MQTVSRCRGTAVLRLPCALPQAPRGYTSCGGLTWPCPTNRRPPGCVARPTVAMKRSTLSTPAALALGGAVSAAVMSLLYVIARERRATRELKAQLNQLLEDTRSKGADAPDSALPSATRTTDRDTHVHTPGHASPGGRGRVVRATPPRRPKERRPSPLKLADRASATQLRSGTYPPAKHAGIVPGGHGRLPIPVPPPGSPSSSKPNLEQASYGNVGGRGAPSGSSG